MKKRLLAFFLAFTMVFSILPVTAFAANTEPVQPFTGIVTDTGADVTAKFVAMVPAATDWATYNDGPYYHVTVPAGTESVKVTYPESVSILGSPNAYSYTLGVPDYTLGYGSDTFAVTENNDGSHTVTIPVANYLLAEDGTGTGMSLEDSSTYDPITFFTFAYAQESVSHSHSVTLTAGEGYTLTGEATVEDGADYTFTLALDSGYVKSSEFAVKADGETLTANDDGSYTVSAVSDDLSITVEGVKKPTFTVSFKEAGNGNLAIGDDINSTVFITADTTFEAASFLAWIRYDRDTVSFDGIEEDLFTSEDSTDRGIVAITANRVRFRAGSAVEMSAHFNANALGNADLFLGKLEINGINALTDGKIYLYNNVGYEVTLPEGEGFTVTGEEYAAVNGTYSFSVTVADGYDDTNMAVKVNGETVTGTEGTYTVESVAADLVITVEGVTEKASSHTVTLTAGTGYTLEGAATVEDGADYSFSLTIENYYMEDTDFAVKANGVALDAASVTSGTYNYVVKNVTEDVTITVEGVSRYYKITLPTAWSQFTLSAYGDYPAPSSDQKVIKGNDYKFTVTPNDGYAVRDNDYNVSFSGSFTGSVEAMDGYAVITLSEVYSNGSVTINGCKQIMTVTLPEAETYTVIPAESNYDPILMGDTYTFTVDIDSRYEAGSDFTVKVNGETVTAVDGVYTVENVSTDLVITVEGVTEKAVNGLSALKFTDGSSSTANEYVLTPAFDPAVKEYTVQVPDSNSNFYAWATRGTDLSSSATITAAWVNLNTNADKTQAITSGKTTGQSLTGAAVVGDKANTVTITVTDGDNADTYTVTIVRTDPTLTALSLEEANLNETFKAATKEYTATTAAQSITVNATPRSENYTLSYNGESSNTVALEMGENKIEIVVKNSRGDENTYTLTVTRVAEITVVFDVTPADAKVNLKDSFGNLVVPQDGEYHLMAGSEYAYTVQKDGYVGQKNSFTLEESGTIEIELTAATENPGLDKTIYAQWANFRNGSNHLGITDAPTPYAPEDAELLWAVKYGTGWSSAPGSPIIVDGDIVTYIGSTIKRLDRNTGEVLAEGTMVGSSSFSIVPPTYADGMIFVGLSGGRIQAFNARTLESLWVYTDELGGQPNCPITYKDGYIYAGFWNSETKEANFACVYTIDEDHTQATEEKLASWTYTRSGGFYWAGAYASDKYVVVGTDNGASDYTTESASLLVFDRITGELVDSKDGIRGDIRSNVSYDPNSDRVFFTSKGGVLCSARIDWATGQITDFDQTVIVNANGTSYAMSTCTPSVYNGRIYIGVCGDSQFGQNSGHAIAVYDLNSDGSMTLAYAYEIMGYPQTSAMVTTAYVGDDGYVYIYLPYNYTPGGVSVLKDKKGQTAPLTTTDAGYSEVFTPVSPLAQYCICSTIADEYGTIYYKNDSCYMMAISSRIDSLEITEYPTAYTLNEDGTYTAEGLKVVTNLKNGLQRDVTDYVTVTYDEENTKYVVSYTYGFDDDNYGLVTLTQDIATYNVTLPEGEGYTVEGETTVKGGEDYTFTVDIDYRYEAGSDFAVKVNGEAVTAVDGVYTVENVSTDLEITVEGVQKIVLKPVTVYFSFSHDDAFEFCEESGAVMALKEVEVPYFDLANYGLESFYFSSETYGDDGDGLPGSALDPGTAEFAYGKVTMLHLFIYATEVYYCGVDPSEAGQGYLLEQGILGTDVFNISGSVGSSFLNNIWNYDLNLNYYLNYEYPLASEGWGSTSDQILLHDGDIVTLGHFTDWSFFNDSASIFNYITASNTEPTQGDEITLTLYHAGADMSGSYTTAHTLIDYCPAVYYAPVDSIPSGDVTEWTYLDVANADGTLTVNTSELAPGEYIFAIAGQPGAEYTDAICSTPGGVRVTVKAGQSSTIALGDVNDDGVINATDVAMVRAFVNNVLTASEDQRAAADVNGDGKIDATDVALIRAYVNNSLSQFPASAG